MAALDEKPERDLDAPSPPGSPMRRDAATADVNPRPGEPAPSGESAPSEPSEGSTPSEPSEPAAPTQPTDPSVQPSGTPDGPQVVPAPSTPEGEPGPDPATARHDEQLENAATSLDEPSDNSGAE